MAEGAPLLREYTVYPVSRVRIPPSPPFRLTKISCRFQSPMFSRRCLVSGDSSSPLGYKRTASNALLRGLSLPVILLANGRRAQCRRLAPFTGRTCSLAGSVRFFSRVGSVAALVLLQRWFCGRGAALWPCRVSGRMSRSG